MQFLYRRLSLKPTLALGFIQIIQLIRCPVNHSKHIQTRRSWQQFVSNFVSGNLGPGRLSLTTSSKVASTGNGDVLGQIWMAFDVDGK